MSIIEFNPTTPSRSRNPACATCKGPTRLTGIEPHPTLPHTDLRTFQCLICDAVQARIMPVEH